MANITIFIDETGSFFRTSATSYIGGWVCKSDDVKKIKAIIQNSVHYFNDYLKAQEISDATLSYPDDIHFMPLHLISERKKSKDNGITVPTEYVPIFFKHLFAEIHKISLQVFRSTGKPAIKPNEQAVYIDILRNTLLQLVDQSVSLSPKIHIDIVIAHRRHPMLYGQGIDDTHAYEKHMIEGLKQELRSAFDSNKPEINIIFADARENTGLMIADFFCGALRWKKNKYLSAYQETRYAFTNGYKQIGSRMIQRIRFIEETDAPIAATLCADALSGDPENDELKLFLKSLMGKMSGTDKSIFCKNIIDLFAEKLDNNPERYSYLHSMKALIAILFTILGSHYSEMTQSELQLVMALRLNKIRIDSHEGKVNCQSAVKEFLSFLDNYGEYTFDNQMQIMQQRIDVALIGVQLDEFNSFQFAGIEASLKEVRDQYYKMFNFDSAHKPIKDNNIARIEGTLGQMYAFQYDMEKDNDLFEMAELCLQADINACIKDSSSWEKANGYLTSLYWKNEELEKATIQFLKESGTELKNKHDIFDLNKNLFGVQEKPFIQLHRLYLCALAAKQKKQIKGLLTEKDYLLNQCDVTAYPRILSAKWVAVMFLMIEDYQNAIQVLDATLANEHTERDIINLPLQLLQHYTRLKLTKKSNFNCQQEVALYAALKHELKEGLIQLGIENYYQNEAAWSVYKIAVILPFYLS